MHTHTSTAQLEIIVSKQRPRRMRIVGSDNSEYQYLLKGNEDPRLDERVMAFFGLVNSLLASKNSPKMLRIRRYSITPLSPSSGLIGWVPDCDTLHSLIRAYREKTRVCLMFELFEFGVCVCVCV